MSLKQWFQWFIHWNDFFLSIACPWRFGVFMASPVFWESVRLFET